jgi:hypothetical protein
VKMPNWTSYKRQQGEWKRQRGNAGDMGPEFVLPGNAGLGWQASGLGFLQPREAKDVSLGFRMRWQYTPVRAAKGECGRGQPAQNGHNIRRAMGWTAELGGRQGG